MIDIFDSNPEQKIIKNSDGLIIIDQIANMLKFLEVEEGEVAINARIDLNASKFINNCNMFGDEKTLLGSYAVREDYKTVYIKIYRQGTMQKHKVLIGSCSVETSDVPIEDLKRLRETLWHECRNKAVIIYKNEMHEREIKRVLDINGISKSW